MSKQHNRQPRLKPNGTGTFKLSYQTDFSVLEIDDQIESDVQGELRPQVPPPNTALYP